MWNQDLRIRSWQITLITDFNHLLLRVRTVLCVTSSSWSWTSPTPSPTTLTRPSPSSRDDWKDGQKVAWFRLLMGSRNLCPIFLTTSKVNTGFSSEGRAKLRVGVLNVPWPKNSKPLEVEGNQKAHHNKTPLSSCSSVLNLFLFMFTHLSNYACTFLGTFPLLGTQLSPSLTQKPCT